MTEKMTDKNRAKDPNLNDFRPLNRYETNGFFVDWIDTRGKNNNLPECEAAGESFKFAGDGTLFGT